MGHVDFSFYVITDRHQTRGRPLSEICRAAWRAGVRAVQLREKDLPTRPLLALARDLTQDACAHNGRLLVNERVDLALTLGLAGVHLPSAGLPPAVARRILPAESLIGVSTHSPEEVVLAEAAGADFVVLGPVFATPSKHALGAPIGLTAVSRARARCRIPIFGIGGITTDRVRDVRSAGAHGVAVVSGVMAADDVERACREFLNALDG
jgi:thiamine-phosphate pyrophosphorylase